MVEQSLYFNSTFGDRRRYGALDIAKYWRSFIKSGLIHADGEPTLRVNANGEDMTVSIDDGKAVLFGHLYMKKGSLPFTLSPSSATEDRFDRIVLRLDNRRGEDESRFIRAFLVEGTAEGPPELERTFIEDTPIIYEISLAQIHVKAGKSFLEQSDIIDERLDEQLCGLASSLVTVPTDIFTQEWKEFVAEYNKWFANLQGSSYATVDDVRRSENNMKREIANLNLQLEANKRVKNGVTFGTNFADTFGMEIDMARTSSDEALSVGQTIITTRDASDFKVGTEVTVFDDVNLERVVIAGINGDIITLESPLAKSYKEGVSIARSMILANKFGRYAQFGAWGSYEKVDFTSVGIDRGGMSTPSIPATYSQYNMTRANDAWYVPLNTSGSLYTLVRIPDSTMTWERTDIQSSLFRNDAGNLSSDGKHAILVRFPDATKMEITTHLDNTIVDTKVLDGMTATGIMTSQFNPKTRELYLFIASSSIANNRMHFYSFPISKSGEIGDPVANLQMEAPVTTDIMLVSPSKNAEIVMEGDDIYVLITLLGSTTLYYPLIYHITSDYSTADLIYNGRGVNRVAISAKPPNNCFFKYNNVYHIALICDDNTTRDSFIGKSTNLVDWEWIPIAGFTRVSFVVYGGGDSIFAVGTGGLVWQMNLDDIPATRPPATYTLDTRNAVFTPLQQEFDRPFILYSSATKLDGKGVIGYGAEITTNDVRFKTKPSKEMVVWIEHDSDMTITDATFGNINLDLSIAGGETQAVGHTTIAQDEVRLTMTRQSLDVDPKIIKILGGVL